MLDDGSMSHLLWPYGYDLVRTKNESKVWGREAWEYNIKKAGQYLQVQTFVIFVARNVCAVCKLVCSCLSVI